LGFAYRLPLTAYRWYIGFMQSNALIWIGMFVGSALGGWIPSLWGDNFLSMSSVLLTAVGGLIGIWIGFKLSR
jgi:hypothetical protein